MGATHGRASGAVQGPERIAQRLARSGNLDLCLLSSWRWSPPAGRVMHDLAVISGTSAPVSVVLDCLTAGMTTE